VLDWSLGRRMAGHAAAHLLLGLFLGLILVSSTGAFLHSCGAYHGRYAVANMTRISEFRGRGSARLAFLKSERPRENSPSVRHGANDPGDLVYLLASIHVGIISLFAIPSFFTAPQKFSSFFTPAAARTLCGGA
jgi:hypothetical protein